MNDMKDDLKELTTILDRPLACSKFMVPIQDYLDIISPSPEAQEIARKKFIEMWGYLPSAVLIEGDKMRPLEIEE